MAGKSSWIGQHLDSLKGLLGTLVRSIIVIFLPLPVWPSKRLMSGGVRENGELRFPVLRPFMLWGPLVTMGWLTACGEWINQWAASNERSFHIPDGWLVWPWVIALIVTMFATGDNFGKEKLGTVAGVLAILAIFFWGAQQKWGVSVFGAVGQWLSQIPIEVKWGVPLIVSLVGGVWLAITTAWQNTNDVWSQDAQGNNFEHHNFEESDVTYSKGAKTFAVDFPCLLKKWFYFRYGYVLVVSHDGSRIYHRVGPVFFAGSKKRILTERFSVTKTSAVDEAIEAEADAAAQSDAEDVAEGEGLV